MCPRCVLRNGLMPPLRSGPLSVQRGHAGTQPGCGCWVEILSVVFCPTFPKIFQYFTHGGANHSGVSAFFIVVMP